MTFGTHNKKEIWLLGGLGVVLIYTVYSFVFSDPPGAAATATTRTAPQPLPAVAAGPVPQPRSTPRPAAKDVGGEFHPVFRSKHPEEPLDPNTIDPTLRLDLLAKLQREEPAPGRRSLFEFAGALMKASLPKGPETRVVPRMGPMPFQPAMSPAALAAGGAPAPAPINLKYYGYSTERGNGRKVAFFLDGDDIVVAAEGETLKRRYRVVRISATSVTMEDAESKRQQPLPLAPEMGG